MAPATTTQTATVSYANLAEAAFHPGYRTVSVPGLEDVGYDADALLRVDADAYYVRLTETDTGTDVELPVEFSAPDDAARAVKFAEEDPVAAVLDAAATLRSV